VRRDDDGDARRDLSLAHLARAEPREARGDKGIAEMRPDDAREAPPEEDFHDDHGRVPCAPRNDDSATKRNFSSNRRGGGVRGGLRLARQGGQGGHDRQRQELPPGRRFPRPGEGRPGAGDALAVRTGEKRDYAFAVVALFASRSAASGYEKRFRKVLARTPRNPDTAYLETLLRRRDKLVYGWTTRPKTADLRVLERCVQAR
jgi:hypothetical protein